MRMTKNLKPETSLWLKFLEIPKLLNKIIKFPIIGYLQKYHLANL
jgi:hypothetical protein